MPHQTVFDSARFFIFLSAASLLAIAPGPGMLYVLARTLGGGRREGLLSALGTFFGGLVHVFAAAAGISIILAKSAIAFATVKYLGAGYLCFLGIRMMLDARKNEATSLVDLPRKRNPFWQGVMTEVLNPKTALFFFAFLPQFADAERGHLATQIVFLGLLFAILGFVTDGCYALLASSAGRWLRQSRRYLEIERYVSGTLFIGLGVTAIFAGNQRK